jgi:hypothetical protein
VLRDQISRLGLSRRIDKWIAPIAYADVVGTPDGFKESSQSAVSWLSDVFLAFHPGGTMSEYSHEILEPLDTIRIPEFEHFPILHQGRAGRFGMFQAFRHKAGKDRVKAVVGKMYPSFVPGQHGEQLFLEGRNVEFRDLRVGDVLEVRYTRDFFKPSEQGPFNWNHVSVGALEMACARRRITLAVHESVEHDLVMHHFDTPPEEWTDRGYRFRRWELRELPALEMENSQPYPRDCEPWIDVSTCPDWKPIAKWLRKHLITDVSSKKEITEILSQHAPADLDLVTRARKCYDYCREQVAYGRAHGVKPDANALPGNRVAKSQRGDCKDQTSLLMGLLTEIGVPCRAAAVIAGDPAAVEFLPSQRFDHVILACEINGEMLWLDPTADHIVFGGIVPELEGTQALLISDDEDFEFRTIPHAPAAKNLISYQVEGHFDDRDLVLDVSIEFRGRFATTLRAWELHQSGSIVKGIEAMCTERLGPCTVEDVKLADGWRKADPITMTTRLTAPNWIKTVGSDIRLIKLPWIGAHIPATSVARKDRVRDYLTGGPDRAVYQLSLRLPDGTSLDIAAGDRDFRGPRYTARTQISHGTDTVALNVTLGTQASRLSADEYGAFRNFVHELTGFFEDQHVLRG